MAEGKRGISWTRYLLMALGLAAIVVAIFMAVEMIAPPPEEIDTARTKTSANELYVVSIEPERTPVPQGRMHSWTIIVTDADGEPVEDARITVEGGMPDHGHGLPTAPAVTKYLGEGKYLLEGLEFNMTGKWKLRFDISSPRGEDTVTFNVVV